MGIRLVRPLVTRNGQFYKRKAVSYSRKFLVFNFTSQTLPCPEIVTLPCPSGRTCQECKSCCLYGHKTSPNWTSQLLNTENTSSPIEIILRKIKDKIET